MAIGLSNVETRKAKKTSIKKSDGPKPLAKSRMASTLIENSAKAMGPLSGESIDASKAAPTVATTIASSVAPPMARTVEAAPLKVRKDKAPPAAELNSLWLEWSDRVAGVEPASVAWILARNWMEIERYVFDLVAENVLRELRKTAFGSKVVAKIDSRRG